MGYSIGRNHTQQPGKFLAWAMDADNAFTGDSISALGEELARRFPEGKGDYQGLTVQHTLEVWSKPWQLITPAGTMMGYFQTLEELTVYAEDYLLDRSQRVAD